MLTTVAILGAVGWVLFVAATRALYGYVKDLRAERAAHLESLAVADALLSSIARKASAAAVVRERARAALVRA